MSTSREQLFEERAAIMEYDGGFSRKEAEWQASLIVYGREQSLAESYEERAAIMEYDGNMSRKLAEQLAHENVYGGRSDGRTREELQGRGRSHVRLPEPVY